MNGEVTPHLMETCRADLPSESCELMAAPHSISFCTISSWPAALDRWRGVCPSL